MRSQQVKIEQQTSNIPLLLIYYNFKGAGQAIRYLLCYLEIPFIDIFLDEYDTQKQTLSFDIVAALQQKPVNKNDLPAIIHNNDTICCYNQCMNYICITFQREDLLGKDLYQKARVCEIQEIYSTKLASMIRYASYFVKEVSKIRKQTQLFPFIQTAFAYMLNQSNYIRELSTFLIQQKKPNFILANITIVDFYFIESSRSVLTLFSCLDSKLASGHWLDDINKYRINKEEKGGSIENIQYLRAMKDFVAFMFSQPFYIKNSKYLQSFRASPRIAIKQEQEGMKKLQATHFMDLYYDNQ